MSACTLDLAVLRCRTAPPESPIAVFRTNRRGQVNCVFANTVQTQIDMAAYPDRFVGVFDCNTPYDELIARLRDAAFNNVGEEG